MLAPDPKPSSLHPLKLLPKQVLLSVCAQCEKFTGYREGTAHKGVSHGYCEECRDAMLRELRDQEPSRG